MSEHLDALRNHESEEDLRELLSELERHGSRFDRYDFRGEIARGGMGVVHRVFDRDTGRMLALKSLLDGEDSISPLTPSPRTSTADPERNVATRSLHRANDPHRLVRFLDEARLTSQLDHPGIVPVHEIGIDPQGRVYFTMKLVEGETLRTVIEKIQCDVEGWTLTRGIHVLRQVCEATAYAHDKGVIHRDLKPSNVMIGRYGEVYVMDWGLARVLPTDGVISAADSWAPSPHAHGGPTHASDRYGTPAYMAPEQARGEAIALAPTADVYAIGAMLYHLLTGHAPFTDATEPLSASDILARVREQRPSPVAELAPHAPRELIAICERAMARDARERYADVNALAADLRAFLERRVVAAYDHGVVARARKWVERNRALASCAVACALLISTTLWVSISRFDGEHEAATASSSRPHLPGRAERPQQPSNQGVEPTTDDASSHSEAASPALVSIAPVENTSLTEVAESAPSDTLGAPPVMLGR